MTTNERSLRALIATARSQLESSIDMARKGQLGEEFIQAELQPWNTLLDAADGAIATLRGLAALEDRYIDGITFADSDECRCCGADANRNEPCEDDCPRRRAREWLERWGETTTV